MANDSHQPLPEPASPADLRAGLERLKPGGDGLADASVVIPVNAQGDLDIVRCILSDLSRYRGRYALEIVLIINNYDAASPPPEIGEFANLGVTVEAVPTTRRPGECPAFAARVAGARAASSDLVVLFDADCRIPDATTLIDWYISEFRSGAKAAYTHVGYFDMRDTLPNRVRMCVHHGARWVKRVVLRIPTLRGSNYAVDRAMLLQLYDEGWLADDMNVGPTLGAMRVKLAYSSADEALVLTSGRMFSGTSWLRLNRYFLRRFLFNLRVLRVRPEAARYTQREYDPERRYVNNRPVY